MGAGRHRTFDKEIALDTAMQLFWSNGYSGTSLSDLTQAMGINKPSLYSAFGNKEELFKSALEKYAREFGAIHAKELAAPNHGVQKRIQRYLNSIAKMVSDPKMPGGCFVASCSSEAGGGCFPQEALLAVSKVNGQTKEMLVDFFTSEKSQGNISSKNSAKELANYLLTVQLGIAAMARNGAKYEELNSVIKQAISVFQTG